MSERDYHDAHYEAESRLFDTPLFRRVHARGARQFLRATRARPAHRVLSLGCGDGSIERLLAPHVGSLVGVDISPVAIAHARTRSAAFPNLSFRTGEGWAQGPYDIVAAFAFLHHLDDAAIRATLRSARGALRPGGMFYSSDPSSRRAVALFRGLVRGAYERYHSPDERELDPEVLIQLAHGAGFQSVKARYTDYFLGPLAWLAPGTPRALAGALEAVDSLALQVPLVRRYASSFSVCAW